METLYEKYHGKTLTPDEAAEAGNAIKLAIRELESIDYKTGEGHILLKWGTLKSWSFTTEKAKKAFAKYCEIGSSESAMTQHDTPEQKVLICEMIDECEGTLQEDWDGKNLTKQQAKDYVMNYGKN